MNAEQRFALFALFEKLPSGREPRSGCRSSGRRLERQSRREGPVGEQLDDLPSLGLQALHTGAEVDDEDPVGVEELVAFLVVVGVDQRRGAAVCCGVTQS